MVRSKTRTGVRNCYDGGGLRGCRLATVLGPNNQPLRVARWLRWSRIGDPGAGGVTSCPVCPRAGIEPRAKIGPKDGVAFGVYGARLDVDRRLARLQPALDADTVSIPGRGGNKRCAGASRRPIV